MSQPIRLPLVRVDHSPQTESLGQTIKEKSENTTYTITVKTSNKFGAGTDANILCELIGQYGKSKTYKLQESVTHKNKFERNSQDVFVFDDQPIVGEIFQVKIWHDNAGAGAAWHLAYVEVTDSSDDMTYTFPCGRWFATNEDDGQIMRVLECTKKGIKISKQFGLKFATNADGTTTAHVYLPTMEFIRDSVATCMHSERKWLRDFLGELLGTMFLVCIIDGACAQLVLSRGTHSDFMMVSFACGMAITFGVYLSGNSSGGHINPAVTLVMVILGRTTWRMLPVYWLAQYLGGIIGAGIVYGVYYDAINAFDGGVRQVHGPQATAGIFATYPQDFLSTGNGWVDQIVGTAVLTQLIFAITDPRNHAVPKYMVPLLVGLIVALVGMSFGFNCGFAINPARDLGPRILTAMVGYGIEVFSYRNHNWFWVPVIGPHVGAFLGTIVYMMFVGVHWPQTFQASEIARKKSTAVQKRSKVDEPSELMDPSTFRQLPQEMQRKISQPAYVHDQKEKERKLSQSYKQDFKDYFNQQREYYQTEKETSTPPMKERKSSMSQKQQPQDFKDYFNQQRVHYENEKESSSPSAVSVVRL